MNQLGTRFLQAAGWQFGGNLLRVLLGLGASVLIVRWLGAAEFGMASWVLSLTMHASIVGSLGVGTPLTRHLTRARLAGDADATRQLLGRVLRLRVGVTVVAALFFVTIWAWSADTLGRMTSPGLLLFVAPLLLASFLHGLAVRVLQIHFRQGVVAALAAGEILFKLLLLRVLGGAGLTAADLLAASVITELVSCAVAGLVIMGILKRMKPRKAEEQVAVPGVIALLGEGRPSWVLAFSERVLGREVDIFLLGLMAGPVEVARYALPFTLASISVSVASSVFQSTTNLTAFTEAGAADGDRGRRALLQALSEFWALFVLPIAVGGVLVGGRILSLLYGEAGEGLTLLSALLFLSFAFSSLSGLAKDALQGQGEDRRPAQVHAVGGVVNLILSLVLIPQLGAEGAALATLLATGLITVLQLGLMPDSLRTGPGRRPLRAVVPALLVLSLGVWLGSRPVFGSSSALGSVLMSVAVGGVGYLAGLAILGPHSSLRHRLDGAPGVLRAARRFL